MTLYVLSYNNYYNRIRKSEATIAEYLSAASQYEELKNVNFYQADGIETSHVVNISLEFDPDYLIVCNGSTIVSRWFVIDSDHNMAKQLILSLRRDVLVDAYNDIKNKRFYLEKGAVPASMSELAYNSEGMTFNSVLKSRELLHPYAVGDARRGKRALVFYIDKTWSGGPVQYTEVYEKFNSWQDSPFSGVRSGKPCYEYKGASTEFSFCSDSGGGLPSGHSGWTFRAGSAFTLTTITEYADGPGYYGRNGADEAAASSVLTYIKNNFADVDEEVKNMFFTDYNVNYDTISEYDDKVISIGGSLYKIALTGQTFTTARSISISGETIAEVIKGENPGNYFLMPKILIFDMEAVVKLYTVSFTAVSPAAEIPKTRSHINAPYDIFFTADSAEAREFAGYFASQYSGANFLYDIQLLPFFPEEGLIGSFEVNSGEENEFTCYFASSDSVHGNFYHAAIGNYTTVPQKKSGANMDAVRICSPSGASIWEFNPAKIGGVAANSIRYEVTFMPYTPYMHVFPTFGGIYGNINRDYTAPLLSESRGFVLSGDYSVPYSSSNWATYQLNNSAYKLAHDRQIENMSINHAAERIQETASIIGGVISGGAAGALAGRGPISSAIGAGIGAIGAAVTGGLTRAANEKLRAEEIGYAEDMFGYNLQNIRAQAQPLTHTNGITIGVAYYPYIEYYSATDTEKTIFAGRLKVNGYSLGIVTTLASALSDMESSTYCDYIAGKLIEYGGDNDAHFAHIVNAELMKGIRK